MNIRKFAHIALIVPAVFFLSTPLLQADDDDDDDDDKQRFSRGIVEIDQRGAEKGKVTGSDRRGFPVTLDSPGSYRLKSNLEVSDPGVDAIEITAENVSLDLNGFTIFGAGGSGGRGVAAPGLSNVSVTNGSVVGMGSHGLELDIAAHVEDVRALGNGGDGVITQGGSTVTNTIANRNGGNGINVGIGSAVDNNNANRNGGDGINARARCTIKNNTANVNGDDGIETEGRCVVIGNAASQNQDYGLELGRGTGWVHNVLSGNNNRAPANRNQQALDGRQMGPNVCGNGSCP